MKRPILLIIDMINDSFGPEAQWLKNRLIGPIGELVDLFHKKDLPVIWVRQEFEPDLKDAFLEMRKGNVQKYIKGTAGAQVVEHLRVFSSDRILIKKRYSAFFDTNLDSILSELKGEALILVGVNTHACIRTTAIDAYQRDWEVILAEDCIGSYDQDHHGISLAYMKDKIAKVFSNSEILKLVE